MFDTTLKILSPAQLLELNNFGSRINKFGVNFSVCDSTGHLHIICEDSKFKSDVKCLKEGALQLSNRVCQNDSVADSFACCCDETGRILSVILNSNFDDVIFVAMIDLGPNIYANTEIVSGEYTVSKLLSGMLEIFSESFRDTAKSQRQVEFISTELSQTYEELVLLQKLSANMKVTSSDSNFLQVACDSLTEIVNVEGIAILLKKTIDDNDQFVISAGSGLIDIDEQMTVALQSRLEYEIIRGRDVLVDSDVDSPLKYNWGPTVKNIVAVPLYSRDNQKSNFGTDTGNVDAIIGVMVAINRIGKADFDSIDIKLFNSVAGECASFVDNGRLFNDLKELFIGSLKALTNSIDAKDRYTRGHSDRVAFISRWIAEIVDEVDPIGQDEIHKIYLAGLLHDIGKLGVTDAVLCKNGKLTAEEFEKIKMHPVIGAGILSGIKQMRDIVPGVLYHHERIDGNGYPGHLIDNEIPMIGKIICLADSFDAMTSMRTYRNAMTVEQALSEIKNGLGTQFDEKIGRLFINSDIKRLWSTIQNGFTETYGINDFSKYGTIAVGTLVR